MRSLHACHPIQSNSDRSVIEYYRRSYRAQGFFVETAPVRSRRGEGLRLEVPRDKGSGWMEMVQIDRGLVIGLCDYLFAQTVTSTHQDVVYRLGFNVLLSGGFEFSIPELGVCEHVQGRELWLRSGRIENIRYAQPAGRVIRGLSIELPSVMVEAWLGGEAGALGGTIENLIRNTQPSQCRTNRPYAPLIRSCSGTTPILQTATRLLATPRDTVYGELQFESLTLDLLAQVLFSLDPPGQQKSKVPLDARQRSLVDEAVDILHKEWADPPTISALARRVGLNDCYLKAWFRKRTGLSVGEYVRKLRMENALELIESGRFSILETALAIGYSNPSHFSAVFKRFHGRLPSCYQARA